LRGTAQYITEGFPVNLPPGITFLGSGDILGVPVPALIFLVVFMSVHFLMNYTTFGRSVYAVGGNAEAARLSGIDVWRIRVWVLAINGMLAYLAGILLAARIGSGIPTAALGMELDVIAAVIIGGTSLFGGSGRVWGTLVGLLFIGVMRNGMTLLNIQHDVQLIVRGGLILVAVWINQTTLKYNSERSR
jgi:ribose/xylose/arabinose/galactoside ABC-type transport system permease subunit